MNKLLLFFIAVAGLFACTAPTAHHLVQFSGVIENPPGETPELDFFRDYINNDRLIIELTLDEKGSFTTSFEVPGPVLATLTIGRSRVSVYLQPGFDLHLRGDAANLHQTLQFSGEGSDENNFLLAYNKDVGAHLTSSLLQEKAKTLDAKAYKQFIDSITGVKLDYLNLHLGERIKDDTFKTFFETQVKYEKYQHLLDYPSLHQRLNGLEDKPLLPDSYYGFLGEAMTYHGQAFTNLTYVNFLLSYLDHKRDGYVDRVDEMSRHQLNYMLAGKYLQDKPRYYIQALSVSREMHSGSMETAMELYKDYMQHSAVEAYKESLSGALDAIRSLEAGNPAPGFVIEDINGDMLSLNDFRGKVVYMKFWASWCGPCMRQVPPAAALKERLEGADDLVFMYVSIDRDERAWRNAVEQHGITGVHMRTPGRERGVPALYNVRWIPTFYLIGKDGMILDHRPPYPDNPEIDAILLNALK